MSNPLDELAAALNDRQITNDQGEIEEETSNEETASQEKNTDEESVTVEKSEEAESEVSEADEEVTEKESEDDSELAEDESGKRYVPERRFKEVYGKYKELQREVKSKVNNQIDEPKVTNIGTKDSKPSDVGNPTKADILELKMTLPQFDPKPDVDGKPTNPDYEPELDRLGAQILRANPGMSPLQAGRQALDVAKKLTAKASEVKSEARTEKAIGSDQGITSRVVSRKDTKVDPDKMSLEEKEAYLRSIGQW